MKKRLLIAAVAATMSVVATADISITGDAYVSFASQQVANTTNSNDDNQRVRIKVVGSTGDTKVVAVIRNGSETRVNSHASNDDGGRGLHMDSLYMTTKAGPASIKVGDYWGTIGLGARSMGAAKKNALSVSTEAGGWKLGLFTANGSDSVADDGTNTDTNVVVDNGSDSTNINVSGKIGPVKVGVVHNPDSFTDLSAEVTFGGISIAAEMWDDTTADTATENDTTFIQISGKVASFNWDIASIENDKGAFITDNAGAITERPVADSHATGKLAPLGSMLIGTNARGKTATAVADVTDFTKILGVAVSTKMAGNTIKVIYTKNTLGDSNKVTGKELIISRPLGGATLTANIGKISGLTAETNAVFETSNASNKGLRLDVKF